MVIVRLAIALALLGTASHSRAIEWDAVTRIEQQLGGRFGVAALDTGSDRRISNRPNERFPMCSTFKFLAVAAVLQRVDENKEQLDRVAHYTSADILEYAPVTKAHLSEGGMTVEALCEAALTQSDNTAANLLLDTMGGTAGLTSFARTIGDEKTRLDRTEPTLNTAEPNDERDTTTPAAMLEDMRRILLGNVLSDASREKLENWMRANQTGHEQIRAGVPKDWVVGDKTGRGAHGSMNDIAILRPPKRAPILLTIYSVGSDAPAAKRMAGIASIAKAVRESLK